MIKNFFIHDTSSRGTKVLRKKWRHVSNARGTTRTKTALTADLFTMNKTNLQQYLLNFPFIRMTCWILRGRDS